MVRCVRSVRALLIVFVILSACSADSDERPAWCVHNDRVQAELALQAELEAEHGSTVADWPSDDLDRWAQSIDDQVAAAGRLWDAAPSDYNWDDVRRECRR